MIKEHGEVKCRDCLKRTYMPAAAKTYADRTEYICYECFYGPVLTKPEKSSENSHE